MLENIALIKEVHELMPTALAQTEASEHLERVRLEHLGQYRLNQCNESEVFHVMFIRALMSKASSVIIVSPLRLIQNAKDLSLILSHMVALNAPHAKNILILDSTTNKNHYEGELCHIIE